jgi:diacylglycerol kinase (ATP)
MKPGLTGINRIIKASGHSMRGIRDAWRFEAAFRQNSTLSVVLFLVAFWLAESVLEWLVLIMPLFLLIIVELLNSAVENAIDRIGPELHELSGRAKDMASAAVFFCLILISVIWLSIIWSKFYA